MTSVRIAFLDFEASSLGKHGYPIEVAWVLASGREESYLIRPAPDWTDWAPEAEAVHHISRNQLTTEGLLPSEVAGRMVSALADHALYASAPSWDGHWLSMLLRAAGLPRHALRLEDTDMAHRRAVTEILTTAGAPMEQHETILQAIVAAARHKEEGAGPPEHRALADARREKLLWEDIRRRAEAAAMQWAHSA